MGDMDAREVDFMRHIYGLDERGGVLETGTPLDVDGPMTHCDICSEELPEPDGHCPDPVCQQWIKEYGA